MGIRPIRAQNNLLPETSDRYFGAIRPKKCTGSGNRRSKSPAMGPPLAGVFACPVSDDFFSKSSGMGFQPFTDFFIGFGGCGYERYWFTHVPQERVQKKRMNRSDQPSAAVIPATPDWMIRATAMMTPAISSATATLPFLSSSNALTSLVSLPRMLMAR